MSIPVVDFSGAESVSNITVMVVAFRTGSASSTIWSYSPTDAAAGTSYLNYYMDTGLLFQNGVSTHKVRANLDTTADVWQSLGFTTDLTLSSPRSLLWHDGKISQSVMSDIAPHTFSTCGGTMSFGRSFTGQLAEILVFNRALTIAEYRGVSEHLARKYGIGSSVGCYASISLSASGEDLLLTNKDGGTEDALSFGKVPCDASYGRAGDGYAWFADPSPGGENAATAFEAPLAGVDFSVSRGLFTEPFTLTLSCAEEDAQIYYTLDHSEPSPENGMLFSSDTPLEISKTTIVRAAAFKDGHLRWNNIITHSYIFLDGIDDYVQPSCASNVWVDGGETPASWGVSTNVITDAAAKDALLASIKAAPIVSITCDDYAMFNPDDGLYTKLATYQDAEHEGSFEWFNSSDEFGTEVGLKMHGAASRRFDRGPKKSFRVKFKAKYGDSKLAHPLFAADGFDKTDFKDLVLRAGSNDSWPQHWNLTTYVTYLKDELWRRVQVDESGYGCAGNFVQLFVNGMFWGVYNVCERPDADFAARTWGGEKDDWNVVKNGSGVNGSPMEIRDGTAEDVYDILQRAESPEYVKSPAGLAAILGMLDGRDFCDYMMTEYFMVNTDWPHNNWAVCGDLANGFPYRFCIWDSEFLRDNLSGNILDARTEFVYSPQRIEKSLEASAEYRLMFADRVHRHMFNGGALTGDSLVRLFDGLVTSTRAMMFAESARWGAYVHDCRDGTTIFTTNQWEEAVSGYRNFLANRSERVLSQFRTAGLYPTIDSPEFSTEDDGMLATLSIPVDANKTAACVYYTTDGSDPREAYSGAVSASAAVYSQGDWISVPETSTVKARALSAAGEWSALSEVELEGSVPAVVKNEFIQSGNGENWDKVKNWSLGYFPNAAGEWAVIGVPTAVKKDKGWRNIHINKSNVTVGHVEVTNGGWTNRIDTGSWGNFILDGGVDANGEAVGATFTVMDEANAGLAMIDLDSPNMVVLASDAEFSVSNSVGDAEFGGLLCKGVWAGNGHNLKKAGPGLMTIAFTNAAGCAAIDKLQVEEGTVAILKPITLGSITKSGYCRVLISGESLDAAVDSAVVCTGKVSVDNPCLFVSSYEGGRTYYGGFVAPELKKAKNVKVYVQDAAGDVMFDGKHWSFCAGASVSIVDLPDGRLAYAATVPERDESYVVDAEGRCVYVSAESGAWDDALLSLKAGYTGLLRGAESVVFDNAGHRIIVNGVEFTVAPYYNAQVDGRKVHLEFNENAIPKFAESEEGANDSIEVGEESVVLRMATQPGLNYTLQFKSSLDNTSKWTDGETVKGDGTVHEVAAEKGGDTSGFYRIKVSD